jgi:hypothetical protein
MIIEAMQTTWDVSYNKDRKTVYKTFRNESTNQVIIEVVQFFYNKNGHIEAPSKGGNVDMKV